MSELSTQEERIIGGHVYQRSLCKDCAGTHRIRRFIICESCDDQGFQWKRVRRA